jgi:2-keto-3-deoxy-galactonokinase
VDPVIDAETTKFRVTLFDGSAVVLKKDEGSGWEESEGATERSKVLGGAIDEFYKIAI